MENNTKFSDLGISKEILQAVEEMGYTQPSPIQEQAIPYVLEGHDVIGQAQTGTGKTAAFAIPIIDLVDPEFNKPQAIILCPTRELAVQVEGEFQKTIQVPSQNHFCSYLRWRINRQADSNTEERRTNRSRYARSSSRSHQQRYLET